MVRKTIKSILNKKLNDWLKHVDDEEIKKIIKSKTIITGGSIVSMLQNEPPKDFDVYFRDKESAYRVAEYYAKKFNARKEEVLAIVIKGGEDLKKQISYWGGGWTGNEPTIKDLPEDRIKILIRSKGVAAEKDGDPLEEPFEDVYDTDIVGEGDSHIKAVEDADDIPEEILEDKEKKEYYRPVFLSMNAITLSNKIQIVIRFFGEPDDIHLNYDFIHCTCYWTSWDNNLVLPALALESIINKQLVYQGSKYPICSVMRMRKFISRGWTINAGQILKMLFQVSKLDLEKIDVLEEQLVGVDSAYFLQLIGALKSKMEKDPNFVISSDYISSILDKLFG
jgi:hypothetical protein